MPNPDTYASEAGYRTAVKLEQAHLGGQADLIRELDSEGVIWFLGRIKTQIATYGSWSIYHYRFAVADADSYYSADGPKGLSMGFNEAEGGLPALLEHLREWDTRDLPPCTC